MIGLAFIIFGRKVRDKVYGPAYPAHCNNCDNDVYMHALKWRSWGHIFWIPLVPWFSRGELVCPICNYYMKLDRSELKRAKKLATTLEALENGDATEDDYRAALKDFDATADVTPVEPTGGEPSRDPDSWSGGTEGR